MIGKKNFRRFVCGFLAVVLAILTPASTYALNQSQMKTYSDWNIFFYDPEGGKSGCYSGNLSGDTVMAKVVSYLKGNNPTGFVLSDNGIAGILANFQEESKFNPFKFQDNSLGGPAYGIAQFDPMLKILTKLQSDPRTLTYYNEYFDLKYTYSDADTGLPKEPVPMEVVDAWLAVQLDYFFGASSEFETTKVGSYRNRGGVMGLDYIGDKMTVHEAMDAAKTPEDATRIFVWIMERPKNKLGDSEKRSQNAQKWYEFSKTISSSGGAGGLTSSSSDGSNVTIIGDSITVGSEAKIRELLPKADIRAQESKQFYTGTSENPGGVAILKELIDNNSLRDVLVYALGTNSSGVTESQAKEIVDLAGSSRKVVFVTNYTTLNDYLGNNNTFTKVKNEESNVLIADWKAAIESDALKYLGDDGIHPNDEGRGLFASIIANAINGVESLKSICIEGSVDGGLTETQAQRLANYYNGPDVDAIKWALPSGKKNCVSFSKWFAGYFTGLSWAGGNGWAVAQNFAGKHGLSKGTEPRPFSIFSNPRSSIMCKEEGRPCGHTGIVVAVSGDKITTIEAVYDTSDAKVKSHDIGNLSGWTFTYLDTILDQSKLARIVNN